MTDDLGTAPDAEDEFWERYEDQLDLEEREMARFERQRERGDRIEVFTQLRHGRPSRAW